VKLSGAAGCCQSAIGAEGFLVVAIIVGCPGCHLARGKTLATVWASHLPPGAYRAIKATLPAGSVVYPPERNARLVGCSKRSNLPPYTGFEHFERIEQRTKGPRGHGGGETPFAPSPSGDICDDWSERVGELFSRPCPDGVRVEWWARACRGAQRFAQQWADQAMHLGWTFDELFVFCEPFANVSRQGGAWFVGDSTVTAVTGDAITLRTTSGATTRIYRKHPNERPRR
jgi:hypothetical protein